jgi:hypothetical protein
VNSSLAIFYLDSKGLPGEQHYFDIPSRDGPGGTITVNARDQKKREECEKAGIILVHVPYW